ncbi:TetR/AcrR family transcriptional regulator [Nocardia yunnanensis]|uniref:TetR/AcrR family transcriptional regulator n=1 Tax=Nocardia yunnanensis TaxID=2382165 RepID=A0A386ZEV0_9NOCA|nr:TetR/AcrR family transcriptional regulator [Nocardia yunnanensis]AYF76038.1 TetR/AcrR family transcriptional regulator [Nocardia yunnanensis]
MLVRIVVDRAEATGGRWGEHNTERRRAIIAAYVELIEESQPGADIPLQVIADRAGVKRSVVYRHFDDRGDLDAKTREFAVEQVVDLVMPDFDPAESLRGTIFRIVATYVGWVSVHARLHGWIERGPGSGDPAGKAVVGGTKAAVAERVAQLFTLAASVVGQQHPGIDPAAFAIVSLVDGGVTRWLETRPADLDETELTRLLADSIWALFDAMARARGFVVNPDRPIAELMADPPVRLES